MKTIYFLTATTLLACGNTPAPRSPADTAAPGGTTAAAVSGTVEPNKAKTISHFKEHVKYPATRSDILAACAQTPEFTSAEKDWLAQRLPEGNYRSADEVVSALHL